jgi:hypothetical protein
VAGRAEGIAHEAEVVDAWFAGQMAGLSPRFVTNDTGRPTVTSVQSTLDAATLSATADVVDDVDAGWHADGTVAADAIPIVFVEGRQSFMDYGACGWWTGDSRISHITMPMGNCDIYPGVDTEFPYGGTYLLAHEMTHALGPVSDNAPHNDGTGHLTDDPRDIISGIGRDWSHMMIDPGHDDYYLTGRTDLTNIESSPLVERP